jgi:alpha-glucoside transport system permease protein
VALMSAVGAETQTATVAAPESIAARIVRVAAKAPVHLLLAAVGVLWLVPTLGLLLTSIMPADRFDTAGWWKVFAQPSVSTWQNYDNLLSNSGITHSLLTTLEIAIGGTVVPILVAALAGYAFAWLEFPGRDWLFVGVIALLVVPLQMALIPIFSLYNTFSDIPVLEWFGFDTVGSLILFHTAFGLPFAIFLLRNFFIGIPKDILESARIDGSSELRIFLRLILPLGLPAIASLAIFQFLWTWNDLLVALTFGRDTRPITVAIFNQLTEFGSNIEIIAPAAFVSLAIPLVVFFAFQRYFVQGLLAGSVK